MRSENEPMSIAGGYHLAVIPARAASSRFPRKVLAQILGKPMIQYVWEAAREARELDAVVIATDDTEVAGVAQRFGAQVELTSSHLPSGTDRVAAVALNSQADIILNLQGDEPLLRADAINALVESLKNPGIDMATLAVTKEGEADWKNPNVVKVEIDEQHTATGFFREKDTAAPPKFLKHIGIYGFRRAALQRFVNLPCTTDETSQRLEQLRALQNGISIRVVLMNHDTIAVDEPGDISRVEAFLRRSKPE